MTSPAAHQPRLRLVGTGDPSADEGWARAQSDRAAVAAENRAAAGNPALDPADPRWVLAVRTAAALQGSALTPERRARVMRTARRIGLRPFDANLIIAIVQDHARRRRDLSEADGLLRLVARAQPAPSAPSGWLRWAAAIAAAATGTMLLVRWLTGN